VLESYPDTGISLFSRSKETLGELAESLARGEQRFRLSWSLIAATKLVYCSYSIWITIQIKGTVATSI
jgi:hypothetical protein